MYLCVKDFFNIIFIFPVPFTESGLRCVFPFTYAGTTYKACTSVDSDSPWCATEVDVSGQPRSTGRCSSSIGEIIVFIIIIIA